MYQIMTHYMRKKEEIEKLKETLAKNFIYTIGRYGGWTYCSMEDCMIEAENLAEKINK